MVSSDEIRRTLKEKKEGINDDKLNCQNCGTENPPGSRYCLNCGTNIDKGKISPVEEKKTINQTKPSDNSFLRKIPGFRSGTPWKMVSSSIVYIIALIIIITLISTVSVNHIPSFEVAGAPVSIVNNNSSTDNGNLLINATIRNTGSDNINVLPVEVYSQGNHIGNFFITNVTSNQNTGFKMNITNTNPNDFMIQNLNGNNINFYPEDSSNSSSSYSLNPGDYKFVIGDQKVNITSNEVTNILQPLINSYNQTKGSSSDTMKIQGEVTGDYSPSSLSAPSTFPVNTNLTIFLKMGTGYTNQGQRQYDNGDVVSAYQSYLDVMVIYWPEMKIVGWHRIMGPPVPDTGYAGGGDIYWDQVNDSTVEQWIASQPKT